MRSLIDLLTWLSYLNRGPDSAPPPARFGLGSAKSGPGPDSAWGVDNSPARVWNIRWMSSLDGCPGQGSRRVPPRGLGLGGAPPAPLPPRRIWAPGERSMPCPGQGTVRKINSRASSSRIQRFRVVSPRPRAWHRAWMGRRCTPTPLVRPARPLGELGPVQQQGIHQHRPGESPHRKEGRGRHQEPAQPGVPGKGADPPAPGGNHGGWAWQNLLSPPGEPGPKLHAGVHGGGKKLHKIAQKKRAPVWWGPWPARAGLRTPSGGWLRSCPRGAAPVARPAPGPLSLEESRRENHQGGRGSSSLDPPF